MRQLILFFSFFIVSIPSFAQQGSIQSASEPVFIPLTKTVCYKLGHKNIPVSISAYGKRQNIVYINLHDDEINSVSAARKLLEKQGGLLIKIMNEGERLVKFRLHGRNYTFDPNRIFSNEGIAGTLEKFGGTNEEAVRTISAFGTFIFSMIPDTASCIVALHNNTDGGYSVKSYMQGGAMEKDAKDVYYNSRHDADDFCFTTDSLLFIKMKEFGFNCVLQDNLDAANDGSLSVRYGKAGKRYINIETELGNENFYYEMLEKLISILDTPTPTPTPTSH